MKTRLLIALAAVASTTAFAQLAAPNEAGVTMGHFHLYVKDVAAHQRFWTEMMGGVAVHNQKLEMIQFPGVMILLRQADPTGPPAGSIVNHFGFTFKDLPAAIAKWKANGIKVEQASNPNQGYVNAPDGIRIEFFGDPLIAVPVQMDHVHMFVPDIEAAQHWYAKAFGAAEGQRFRVSTPGWVDCVFIPGVNLSFNKADMKQAPTAGRAIDHIGFDVANLEALVKRLEAQGTKLDEPVRASQNSTKLKVTYVTDPWGTRIELTQGLAP